ncbi:MAG: hypothetical protein E6Q97_14165 [Desulfurellales bacterium]|nr:MAG: hypothetical protein E6Q97_14165 [Desulfurellales bacterium]
MTLRVNVALTDYRQVDVDADRSVHPSDLKALIDAAVRREWGDHDEIRVVIIEEVIGEEATHAPDQ